MLEFSMYVACVTVGFNAVGEAPFVKLVVCVFACQLRTNQININSNFNKILNTFYTISESLAPILLRVLLDARIQKKIMFGNTLWLSI